jgi:son of sevenless-like protein
LTDLTFIETGNQDVLHDKINFRKRVLIYEAIQDVTLYQTSQYTIKVKDPLHELLRELPHNANENELYNLSLFFEPRV